MLETLNYDTGRGGYNMADYRLPMDADGVKYHGTVDQNEENPGQFMYGLDENGNKRIIRTDEQGNVLTRVTGSILEQEITDEIGDIPADTTATAYIDVPDGYVAFSLMCRTYSGRVENTAVVPAVGRLGWSRFRKHLEQTADASLPNSLVFTDKFYVTTNVVRIEIKSTSDEDIEWVATGGSRGVRLFWHRS